MSEPSERNRRWVIRVGIVVVVLSLLASLFVSVRRSDLAAEQASRQMHAGMTRLEARQVLEDIPHVDAVHKGNGRLFFYGDGEFVVLTIEQNMVTEVEHRRDEGPLWERLRRKGDRVSRSWSMRFR
jgi:hypothetical protein